MLMGFMPLGGALKKKPATVTYAGVTSNNDTSNPSSSVPIGTAAADRYVAAIVFSDTALGGGTITSMTIGGIACTRSVITASTANTAAAIFITNSPIASGTTATLSLTGSNADGWAFATYALTGVNPTATATGTDDGDDPSLTIDVPAGGVLIAGAVNDTDGLTVTWTGVTADDTGYDFGDSIGSTSASASFGTFSTETDVTARTITANWSSSSTDRMVVAAWGPA